MTKGLHGRSMCSLMFLRGLVVLFCLLAGCIGGERKPGGLGPAGTTKAVDPKVAKLLKTLSCQFFGHSPVEGGGADSVTVPPGGAENEGAAKIFVRLLALQGDGPEADALLSKGRRSADYSVAFFKARLCYANMRVFFKQDGYRIVLHFTDSPKEKKAPPIIQVVTADNETTKELDNLFAAAIAKKEAGEYK